MTAPPITGVHHLKLPVSDLPRSRRWYESVLGLRVQREFHDDDGSLGGWPAPSPTRTARQ